MPADQRCSKYQIDASAFCSQIESGGLLSCKSGPGYIGSDGGPFSPCPRGTIGGVKIASYVHWVKIGKVCLTTGARVFDLECFEC